MIRVSAVSFDPQAELAVFSAGRTNAGALASFVGLCRGSAAGAPVLELVLDHYSGFTEAAIETMDSEARRRFDLIDTLIVHRSGAVAPGDPIVLVGALATHRKPALQAVDFLMDYLKTEAPFWKREQGPGGARWIEPTAADYSARDQWKDEG
jgi:molybdopterin synthase catalytic subunit